MTVPSLNSSRRSVHVLAVSVVLGILLPPLAALLRPLLFPSIFFLMLCSLAQVDLKNAGTALFTAPCPVVRVTAWQMLVLPLVAGLIHVFAPFSGDWSEFMLLAACAGTIFGAPAFAQLLTLDTGLVLLGVLASTLIMPVVLPLSALWALGGTADFDLTEYSLRLLVFLVVPALIAAVYHRLTRPAQRSRNEKVFRLGSVIFLSVFAIAIMDGVGGKFITQTQSILSLLLLAFAVHIFFLASTVVVFSFVDRRTALAAGIICSYRNLGLLMAVAGAMLPHDFILFVALWQIPMYVMPLLAGKFLGTPP